MSFGFGFSLPAVRFLVAGYNPFNQNGPTLDLSFIGTAPSVTNLSDPNGFTLDANFIVPQYQIAAEYVIWEDGMGLVSKTFSQIITFTRASTATYFDSAGVLQSAAIDVPRFDYNPSTLAAQGFLIEEARTNSIRNNTMQGAVAGTPGTAPTNWTITTPADGLSADIVAIGTSDGIDYIDVRYSGTSGTGGTATRILFDSNTQIVVANGQTWTGSAWFALVGGSLTNVNQLGFAVRYNNAAGAQVALQNVSLLGVTSAFSRITNTYTAADPSIERVIIAITADWVNSSAIDFTLRIGLPQLEQGAFATSVIPTTTTALTRAADVASVNTLSPWFNAAEGTLYAEFSSNISPSSTNIVQASFNDTTANNRFSIQSSTSARALRNTGGAGLVSTPQTANSPVSGINKVALAVATADAAICLNGGTVATDTVTAYAVPTVTRLQLGNQIGAAYLNGWLRRATYYPRKLSNAELISLTT